MVEYSLPNGLVEADVPVEVGHNNGHFWFPSLHRVGDDTLVCAVIRSADVAQGQWPADLFVSKDGATTWTFDQSIDSFGHASVCHNGSTTLMMPYELWPVSPDDYRNGTAPGTLLRTTADGALEAVPRDV